MTAPTWHHGVTARWWAEFRTTGPEIEYFRRHVEPGQPALDLACGTGRLLTDEIVLMLERAGFVEITVRAALTDAEPTAADDFLVYTARRPARVSSGAR